MSFQEPLARIEDQSDDRESALTQFVADIAGSLFAPTETLRSVGERGAVVPALLLVMLVVVVSTAGQMVVLLMELMQVPGFRSPVAPLFAAPTAAFQLASMLWNLIWVPVFWTILAGILYLFARLLGGHGQFGALWAASGFALTPQLLVAPFASVGELMSIVGGGAQFIGWLVTIPLLIGGFIWTVALYVIAVRETMTLSTGRSIGALALLFAVVSGFILLMVCVFVLFMVVIFGAIAAA